MYDRTWTITDEDGKQPTREEMELFFKWVNHESCRPRISATANTSGTKFSFTETDRPTFAKAEAAAQHHANRASDMMTFIEAVKLSVDAEDWDAVRHLYRNFKKV